jgi:hypothetical protein
MTLIQLIKAKPEWANLPMAVVKDGVYHYINASGTVYDALDLQPDEQTGKPTPVLVFSAN